MTRDEAEKALQTVAALLDRAQAIAEGPPCLQHIPRETPLELSIDGGEATLTWCDKETSYDMTLLEEHSQTFPVAFLLMSDAEFEARQSEERRKLDEARASLERARQSAAEADERAMLRRLKAKYEPPA